MKDMPQIGNILISEPFLQDDHFARSVILLCDIQPEGSVGFILNKPSILKLQDLVQGLDFLDKEVFVGGPVEQNSLHYIYIAEIPILDSISIGKNLWWGGDFDVLIEEIKIGNLQISKIRFFLGYSGWSAGQLEEECSENAWIICQENINQSYFDNTSDQLWKNLLQRMGGEFKALANYPIDPRLN